MPLVSPAGNGASTFFKKVFPQKITIPLLFIFILQVLIVVIAFAAVVIVLSERQRHDFEVALNSQLAQQQTNAIEGIVGPLLSKSSSFVSTVQIFREHYVVDKSLPIFRVVYRPRTPPADNSTLDDAVDFYQQFYIFPHEDQLMRKVAWVIESNETIVGADGRDESTWAMFLSDSNKMATMHNGNMHFCRGPHPIAINTSGCAFGSLAFSPNTLIGSPDQFPLDSIGRFNSTWLRPGIFYDPVDASSELGIAFLATFDGNMASRPFNLALLVFSLSHIRSIIEHSTASERSKVALYSNFYGSTYVQHGQYFVAGSMEFTSPDTDVNASNAGSWMAHATPDSLLNAAFLEAKFRCFPTEADDLEAGDAYKSERQYHYIRNGSASNKTYREHNYNRCASPSVFDAAIHDELYTITAVRVLDTDTYFDWMLVQLTPREVFYAASDRARLVGIVIGVLGALTVFFSCGVVWFLVRSPLIKLSKNMNLAAMLRNDEVSEQRPILKEMGELVAAFNQMNERLLMARPFLPQTALLAQQGGGRRGLGNRSISMLSIRSNRQLFGGTGANTDESNRNFADSGSDSDGDLVPIEGVSIHGAEMSFVEDTGQHFMVRLVSVDGAVSNMYSSDDSAAHDHAIAFGLPGFEGNSQQQSPQAPPLLYPQDGVGPHHAYFPSPQVFNLFAVNLELRRIGVLAINVRGFHHYSKMGTSSEHFVRVHTALAGLIESVVRSERGVVDYFHGDHFVCGFNTVKHALCPNPARSAAMTACGIWNGFSSDILLSGSLPSGLAMGMSTGKAEVGNHGTETMQRLGMIGPVFGEALKLQDIMSRMVLGGSGRAWKGPKHSRRKAEPTPLDAARPRQPNASEGDACSAVNIDFTCTSSLGAREDSDDEFIAEADPDDHAVVSPPLSSAAAAHMANGVAGRCLVVGRSMQEIGSAMHCQLLGAVDAAHLLPSVDNVRRGVRVDYSRLRNNQLAQVVMGEAPTSVHADGGERQAAALSQGDVPLGATSVTPTHANAVFSPKGVVTALAPRVLVAVIVAAKQNDGDSDAGKGLAFKVGGGAEWLHRRDADTGNGNPFAAANVAICKLFAEGSSAEGQALAGVNSEKNTIRHSGGDREKPTSLQCGVLAGHLPAPLKAPSKRGAAVEFAENAHLQFDTVTPADCNGYEPPIVFSEATSVSSPALVPVLGAAPRWTAASSGFGSMYSTSEGMLGRRDAALSMPSGAPLSLPLQESLAPPPLPSPTIQPFSLNAAPTNQPQVKPKHMGVEAVGGAECPVKAWYTHLQRAFTMGDPLRIADILTF